MVQISQDEINRDMDSYLSSKSKQADRHIRHRPESRPLGEDLPADAGISGEDMEFDSINEPWYHKILDVFIGRPKAVRYEDNAEEDMAGADAPVKAEAQMPEEAEPGDVKMEKKKGLFAKISSWFGGEESAEAEFAEEEKTAVAEAPKEALDPEIKKLLKIQHKWMEKLPPEVIAEFRDIPEYAEYKMLLEKYHLIKKAEPEKRE